ncbi:DUF2062 domain-containing protein [Aureimonas flava]|uniref:DUF2062 domain-containing protein n=1 Tax=Aureimonas flava TaxID=2320271 RepID=A0A3A1WMW2_9HYPH|nr:DUF2062 domain-containing protein [Aureimonas flava]RIY01337.1 DUF2062 domain-containing protein [Aureimonas flava]
MLFRRRQPETLSQRLRAALWPRRSWRRSLTYMKKRVLRLRATPHAIAAGVAAGVFATCTPLLGFHFVMAFVIAYLIRGSLPAAALGCLIGNPLTYPLIWGATFEIGRFLLAAEIPDGRAPESLGAALSHGDLAAIWAPYLKPMLIGSIPLGLAFALVSYALVLVGVRSFQAARGHKTAAAPAAEPVP